eukprot:gene8962-16601_t
MSLNQITVYCGSNPGKDPSFIEAAKELGGLFLQRNIALIYGGSSSGLMGCIAQVISNGGGKVTGVIPQFMCGGILAGNAAAPIIRKTLLHLRYQMVLGKDLQGCQKGVYHRERDQSTGKDSSLDDI